MGRRARLFVVSGPSGVGKGTIVAKVRDRLPGLGLTVSATTRAPREGEADGISYYFLPEDEFTRRVDAGEFVEWANVHGKRYGTLVSEVDRLLGQGSSVILEIDVQGGLNVRRVFPDAVLVFVDPPSMEELERRLRERGSETEESIRLRMADAEEECRVGKECYDVHIVNDELGRAVDELVDLIERYENEGVS